MSNKFEVIIYDKTVWVNSMEGCVARHCSKEGEIFIIGPNTRRETIRNESYAAWCIRVENMFGIDVNKLSRHRQ